METSTSFEILVIILSVMLAIFLSLSIAVMVMIVKLIKQIRGIVEKAEHIADKADNITSFFENTATPVAIARLLGNITEVIKGKNKK
jgi:uncharacterized protein YpmB